MAKDPAILFYPADFMIGTAFFTHAQRGQYISLLCYQHQLGHLTEKQIIDVCGSHDPEIFAKFAKDEEGRFYNVKMENEKIRRQEYCQSRKDNRSKAKDMSNIRQSHVGRMETETETVTKAITKQDDGVKGKKEKKVASYVKDNPPSLEDCTPYCLEKGIDPQQFHDANTAVGWVDKNKVPYRDWKAVVRKWANYRKATGPIIINAAPSKRPIALVVLELIALKKTDHEIMQELAGKYTEHAIIEACGHARGKAV